MQNKALSMLGLCARAGKVVSGEFSTEKAVKTGKARLVVVAEDASENTKKSFSDSAAYYHVPLIFCGSREELGKMLGKEFRASCAVLDENMAKAVLGNMKTE